MGIGPNYVLDKGLLVQGSAAVVFGTLYQMGTAVQTATPHTATNQRSIGVAMENIDAARVATGKVFADFRILGIARVRAGAAVAAGSRVSPDATGRAIVSAAASIPVGIAMTAAGAAEEHIDVLLTPGMPAA
jgi:tetrahydrodipicolinate N-succinyltransferase